MSANKKALLIGINYNTNPEIKLNGCVNDIVNISNVLSNHFHYEKSNIKELRDDSNDRTKMPTRENILHNLIELVNDSANLSEIWIHYSGHGSQMIDVKNPIKEGIEDVIIPVDYQQAGFILDIELFNIIQHSKCKTMMIFDCCHSGTVCDLEWCFQYKNNSFTKYQIDEKEIKNPDIYCFSGCKDSQTSADAFSPRQQLSFGAFTDSFIHCLKENDFNMSILKLYADICKYILSKGYIQTPVLSSSSQIPNYIFSSTLPKPSYPADLPIINGGWATAADRSIDELMRDAPAGSFQMLKTATPVTPLQLSSIFNHIQTTSHVKVENNHFIFSINK